ncbi:MAG: hypothetical protein AB7D06_04265 [Pedobacter sp.]
MAHSGWQISTLQEPEIIQLEIYGPFTEQNIISALSETLALAQTQKINKVLIDKRKTTALASGDTNDTLGSAYQMFLGQSQRTALLFSDQHRFNESVLSLMQIQAEQTDRLNFFFDRDHALHWLAR